MGVQRVLSAAEDVPLAWDVRARERGRSLLGCLQHA
jgi:hypothetical protein